VREDVYSIFLMLSGNLCSEMRYKVHSVDMSTSKALKFMRGRAPKDLRDSRVFKLAKPFTQAEYYSQCRVGTHMDLFEPLFKKLAAGPQPLMCVTMVQDGVIKVSASISLDDTNLYLRPEFLDGYKMDDWLAKYRKGSGIDIPQLINDDFYEAIRLTFNAGKLVSSMKLLLSCLDSLAYVEYGDDKQNPFVAWLDEYADIASLGITSAELWELRNGLLHMTNLNSKKVRTNKVRQISFRVGADGDFGRDGIYFFDFKKLIDVCAVAINRWIASYNVDRSKFAKFVERYDMTISDSRIAILSKGTHTA